jgi:hypothetical protein
MGQAGQKVFAQLKQKYPRRNRRGHFCFMGLSNGYCLRAQVAHDTEVAEHALHDIVVKIKPWTGQIAGSNV